MRGFNFAAAARDRRCAFKAKLWVGFGQAVTDEKARRFVNANARGVYVVCRYEAAK